MKKRLEIEYQEIGLVVFEKSAKAKRINISYKQDRGFRVAIPNLTSFESGKRFFAQNMDWAKSRLALNKKNNLIKSYIIMDNEVKFIPSVNDALHLSIKGIDNIVISYPEKLGIEHAAVQKAIKNILLKALKVVAKVELKKRTYQLARELNFEINEVRVKDISSRWGSCSIRNNINLSVYLAKIPKKLRDYVILHELAHTKIKNHQKEFWDFMESILPSAKKIDRELKEYKAQI